MRSRFVIIGLLVMAGVLFATPPDAAAQFPADCPVGDWDLGNGILVSLEDFAYGSLPGHLGGAPGTLDTTATTGPALGNGYPGEDEFSVYAEGPWGQIIMFFVVETEACLEASGSYAYYGSLGPTYGWFFAEKMFHPDSCWETEVCTGITSETHTAMNFWANLEGPNTNILSSMQGQHGWDVYIASNSVVEDRIIFTSGSGSGADGCYGPGPFWPASAEDMFGIWKADAAGRLAFFDYDNQVWHHGDYFGYYLDAVAFYRQQEYVGASYCGMWWVTYMNDWYSYNYALEEPYKYRLNLIASAITPTTIASCRHEYLNGDCNGNNYADTMWPDLALPADFHAQWAGEYVQLSWTNMSPHRTGFRIARHRSGDEFTDYFSIPGLSGYADYVGGESAIFTYWITTEYDFSPVNNRASLVFAKVFGPTVSWETSAEEVWTELVQVSPNAREFRAKVFGSEGDGQVCSVAAPVSGLRNGTLTFTIVNPPDAEMSWSFTGGGVTMPRNGGGGSSSWTGAMVHNGTVSVTWPGLATPFSCAVQITDRNPAVWAMPLPSLLPQALPVPPNNWHTAWANVIQPGVDLGLSRPSIGMTGGGFIQVDDNGPNKHFWYVSARPSVAPGSRWQFDVHPQLFDVSIMQHNQTSAFMLHQCGTWPGANGVASRIDLVDKTLEHEVSGTTTSHLTMYLSEFAKPERNPGLVVERVVALPSVASNDFNNQVATALTGALTGIFDAIKNIHPPTDWMDPTKPAYIGPLWYPNANGGYSQSCPGGGE